MAAIRVIIVAALLTVGCGSNPLSPTSTHAPEAVVGTSVIVDSVSQSTCIVSLLDRARQDYNQLTGTLTDTGLTLTDQFGGTVNWTRRGDVFSAVPADSISGPCGVREHVVSAEMDLTRIGNLLTGTRTNHYDLYTMEGSATGQTVTDTEAVRLVVEP